MNDAIRLVAGANLVVARFGSWPEFHDAEVTRLLLLAQDRVLELDLRAFKQESQTDSKGFYKRSLMSLITIQFREIANLQLADFNEQNAIFALALNSQNNRINVKISPSYGLRAAFDCAKAEVISVQPL